MMECQQRMNVGANKRAIVLLNAGVLNPRGLQRVTHAVSAVADVPWWPRGGTIA